MSGPLLRHQADISAPVPMPVDRVDDTSVSNSSTAETVVWYYLTGGAWAAAVGQDAGTICTAKLSYSGVLNSMGTAVGSYNDTSLSFAAATRAAQVKSVPEDVLTKMVFMSPTDQKATIAVFLTTAGDYFVDHRRGQVWLNSKATVANDSATYQYATPLSGGGTGDKVDVIKFGGVAVLIDDAAFGVATSPVLPAGFLADETATDSVNEGDVGAARITLDRRQINASEYAEDSVFANASYLTLVGAEVDDPTALAAMTEGDVGNIKTDLSGRIITTDGTLRAGEVLTEGSYGVQATVPTPLATSTFTSSKSVSSALEASAVVKATAGNLYRTFGVIDKSAPTGMYYVLHLNASSLPGDGAVTHLITPIPVSHTTGTDSSFDTGHFPFGTYASTGIVRVLSSTMVTKTITSAYMFATTSYL